tara:strand:- start:4722 stop:5171 length:450 start_codon:yes stop_codon:yes gene_type:complete
MISFIKLLNEEVTLTGDELTQLSNAYEEMGLDNEWGMEDLNRLLEWLNTLPETITLYRLLYLHEGEEIDTESLGDHYSPNKKELLYNHYNKGSIYSDAGDKVVLITVGVNKDQIDIFNTLHNNIYYPHEQEITLQNKGKGTTLIDIKSL